MKNNTPKVSVLMPNYNGEKYLIEAIESILSQSFTNFEFIIIDDGSSDDSWKMIQNYAKKDKRIVAVKNKKNLKICKTLNKWITLAKWEYIARMDSDDISMLDRFEKQVKFLDDNPDVWIVGWTMDMIDESWSTYSKREYNLTDSEIRSKLFRYSPFCHPVVMIRKSTLDKSGWYDNQLVYSEDYDLYFRLWMHAKFWNLTDTLIRYRMYRWNSTTKKLKQMERGTIKIRNKAVKEYWYQMSIWDYIYNRLQSMSTYLIPWGIKIWLFNLIRNS